MIVLLIRAVGLRGIEVQKKKSFWHLSEKMPSPHALDKYIILYLKDITKM